MKNENDGSAALKEKILGGTGLEDVSTQDIYREILRRFDARPYARWIGTYAGAHGKDDGVSDEGI